MSQKRQRVSHETDSTSVKRGTQQVQEETEENPGWDSDDVSLNSDVQLLDSVDSDTGLYAIVKAIRTIQSQFLQTCPHFVTASHLYAYMRDVDGTMKTDVDIGVEELKKRHLLTCLYMPGIQDVALLETREYTKAVRQVSLNVPNILLKKACEWFEGVVERYCGPTFPITVNQQLGPSNQNNRADVYLQLLVQNDLILRTPHNNGCVGDVFGFKMPNSGEAVRSIVSGRNELVSKIKRRKNEEILLSKINTIKLVRTSLPMEWHVKDIIGSGLVHVVQTTVGPALRVLKE